MSTLIPLALLLLPLADGIHIGGGVLGAVIFVLDVIAIISVLGGHGSVVHKLLWTLLIVFLPVIGLLLYFLLGRSVADA